MLSHRATVAAKMCIDVWEDGSQRGGGFLRRGLPEMQDFEEIQFPDEVWDPDDVCVPKEIWVPDEG